MSGLDLGANHFTFTGENTSIVFDTQTPGPLTPGEDVSGGQLQYQGVEGDHTFRGKELVVEQSALGTLITIVLKVNNDTGGLNFTLLLPHVTVSADKELSFQILGVKMATRGFIAGDGPQANYAVFPLLGTAQNVEFAL